ncbi:hypothetical protein [Rhizobium sp. F40D2]|uniref:hypothetical protein n=1 Tax=Rhizobium sp. F40D2 TaxID=3453141 RepID=UPI003F229AC5
MFTVQVKRKKNNSVLRHIGAALSGPKTVKVGFPAGEADQDNINKAIWNEFGTKGGASGGGWGGPIPERPFLRNAIRENRGKYREAMRSSAAKILVGKTGLRTVLSKLGITAQGDIQTEMTSLTTPINADATIALKGSSKPLIDSGEMRGAVTWKVNE